MRAVVQRVTSSSVSTGAKVIGRISSGLCIFLGVGRNDTEKDVEWIVNKIIGLRIFEDEDGKMNKSLVESGGAVLLVSQFTLYGDCRKGRRPSFGGAASPETAKKLYERCCDQFRANNIEIETGRFQSYMHVNIDNDGPVTFIINSPGSEKE